ncbi:MAG: DUF362 domain-containing protein [Phototrophicaceae bacterium]
MGKLAHLTTVKTARTASFAYTPPAAAFEAVRILVKPTLGYAAGHPVTVSMPVMAAVLRGLRRANPNARILIVEGQATDASLRDIYEHSGLYDLLDDNMRLAATSDLRMQTYDNPMPIPAHFEQLEAPGYIADYDCCISVAPFKRIVHDDQPRLNGPLADLYELLAPGQTDRLSVMNALHDVYFTIGHHFDGTVIDLTEMLKSDDERLDWGESVHFGQVIWGDDMLAVEESACRLTDEPLPDYINSIRALREMINTQQPQK